MEKTILSIQSHVAHGFVGNRVATFTLQGRWELIYVGGVVGSTCAQYSYKCSDGT